MELEPMSRPITFFFFPQAMASPHFLSCGLNSLLSNPPKSQEKYSENHKLIKMISIYPSNYI
jgi:hypothetical protein